tara:strand:+ start:583 stop:894 length:312 start_codon:yes stop_codon:yes gene_type:complete
MIILEYSLEAGEGGMRCPPWVDDGGYFKNSADDTLIGVTRDNPEIPIPLTTPRLTVEELEERVVALHDVTPMVAFSYDPNAEEVELTEAEVRTSIQNWVASKS